MRIIVEQTWSVVKVTSFDHEVGVRSWRHVHTRTAYHVHLPDMKWRAPSCLHYLSILPFHIVAHSMRLWKALVVCVAVKVKHLLFVASISVSKWKHVVFCCFLVTYTEESRMDHRRGLNLPQYIWEKGYEDIFCNLLQYLNSPELSLHSQGGLQELIGGQFCGYILAQTSF